jgi:hypothetical protein
MIVISDATVLRVKPIQNKDKTSGEITNIHQVDLQHYTNGDVNTAEIEVLAIKLKDPAQAEAFRKAVGQMVRFPARVWAVGGGTGFWLEKGVLPTVIPAQQPKAG